MKTDRIGKNVGTYTKFKMYYIEAYVRGYPVKVLSQIKEN